MSNVLKAGGPAFPNITPDMPVDGYPGMSLRDWFAGQALVVASRSSGFCSMPPLAAYCYEIADAMLAERDKEKDNG